MPEGGDWEPAPLDNRVDFVLATGSGLPPGKVARFGVQVSKGDIALRDLEPVSVSETGRLSVVLGAEIIATNEYGFALLLGLGIEGLERLAVLA